MKKFIRIKILAFAKFQSLLMALVGLLFGVLYSFGGLIIDTLVSIGWMSSSMTSGLSYGTALAFVALMGMPILFAIFGFILGLVEAVLYNLFAKWFRGLTINFLQE